MSLRLFLPIAIAAGVVVGAPVASQASLPPAAPVLVTPNAIDGNVLGGNDAGFVLRIKADVSIPADLSHNVGPALIWKRHGVIWATLLRSTADNRTMDFDYFGRFRTRKGDTNGTPLAVFRSHWPGARVVRSGSSWNATIRGSKTEFGFNRSGKLVGVRLLGPQSMLTGGPLPLSECFYPDCDWDGSPYDGSGFLP